MLRIWLPLVLLFCVDMASAQGLASVLEHVPGDSCLAVTSEHVGETCTQFQLTRLGETLTGPNFSPLIAELHRRHLGGPLFLRPIFGFDWSDLEQLSGSGGLFVFSLPKGKPALAWLFDGASGTEGKGPLSAALRYFGEQGFRTQSIRQAGALLTILSPPDARKDESPRVLISAETFHGVVNSPEAADVVLNLKPSESLAANPAWQQAPPIGSVAIPGSGEVRFLVRPIPLWELARGAAPKPTVGQTSSRSQSNDEPMRDSLESSRQLGFDAVQSLVGHVTFPAGGATDWEIAISVSSPRPLAKTMRLLEMPAGPPPQMPEFVASNVTSLSAWRWNFSEAMKGFGNLFDESNEPGPDGVGLFEDMLDALRDDPEGVQVDLRREVFAHLGPKILCLTDRQGRKTEELPEGDRALYVTRVRDVPAVTNALTRFYEDDDRVKHERQDKYDLWTVSEGASLFIEGESDSVVTIRALALGQGRMLLGTDEELLRSTLAGGSGSDRLIDNAAWAGMWQAMSERTGERGAFWAITRLDDFVGPAYRHAVAAPTAQGSAQRGGGPLVGLWRFLLFGTTSRETRLPFAAAPTFERVRSSLPPTSTTISPTKEGWNVTISALRREE